MSEEASAKVCQWRTGVLMCRLIPTAGKYCLWHQHWVRLVDVGNLGRQQREEFGEWWDQFQPYGLYAENPGQWWADVDVLWQCLTGHTEAPCLTDVLARELYIRRAEVRRYLSGLPMGETPWDRVSGLPLPAWIRDEWQAKVDQKENSRVLPAH
jgi:hypothetical protein